MTLRGARKLHEWLRYCVSIGWPLASLDGLQKLWEQYHDENGNLVTESGHSKSTENVST